jgi:DNA mismatch endonuclease (patch repair protein)
LAHRKSKTALFIDSCFWHGCHEHLRMPLSNRDYWLQKISRNRLRDLRVNSELRRSGWLVIRVGSTP